MMITFSKLAVGMSLLPSAFASYWWLEFYGTDDCTGTSPAAFGDSVGWGCTAIGTNDPVNSASSPNYDGSFQVQVYTSTDCSGDPCFLGVGCCVGEWKSFLTFARN